MFEFKLPSDNLSMQCVNNMKDNYFIFEGLLESDPEKWFYFEESIRKITAENFDHKHMGHHLAKEKH